MSPSDLPPGAEPLALFGTRVLLAEELVLDGSEAGRLREALGRLLGAAAPRPLLAPGGGSLAVSREDALDCAAALFEAADRAAEAGECVAAYALLGITGRLLDLLVGEGQEGIR